MNLNLITLIMFQIPGPSQEKFVFYSNLRKLFEPLSTETGYIMFTHGLE